MVSSVCTRTILLKGSRDRHATFVIEFQTISRSYTDYPSITTRNIPRGVVVYSPEVPRCASLKGAGETSRAMRPIDHLVQLLSHQALCFGLSWAVAYLGASRLRRGHWLVSQV
jgi:hypothetical protein